VKEQLFITQEDKNNNMIAINLNTTKNILKIAILAILTYLTFSITYNNHVVPHINYTTEDTTTIPPKYF
jgi:hypothetical protein